MKSNAQLRRDDSDDEVPIPAAILVGEMTPMMKSLKSILGVGPKVKDSIEDPFR
jgi:hypothetical protein